MFERWLEAASGYYWEQGYACIEKTPEPMIPLKPYGVRKKGQFIACYSKQAQPDFKGVLCDGTCIIFDAKHTDADRIQQSAVTDKQKELFDKYEMMGAHCYVVVSIGLQSFYRVPWDVWKHMKENFGHKYMAVDKELKEYQVPYNCCTVKYLEGVALR
nr:MAG TPA: recombination protein [Caudoviricetes sp.]